MADVAWRGVPPERVTDTLLVVRDRRRVSELSRLSEKVHDHVSEGLPWLNDEDQNWCLSWQVPAVADWEAGHRWEVTSGRWPEQAYLSSTLARTLGLSSEDGAYRLWAADYSAVALVGVEQMMSLAITLVACDVASAEGRRPLSPSDRDEQWLRAAASEAPEWGLTPRLEYPIATPAFTAWLEHAEGQRAAHPNRDDPRLPVHKLMSNDGWLLTEVECRGFLGLAERHEDLATMRPPPELDQDRAAAWCSGLLAWVSECAELRGGVRVW